MSWTGQLARTSLFADLPDRALEEIGSRAHPKRFAKEAVVFVQGDYGGRCYLILDGSIKISAHNSDGREVVLAMLGPRDVFGELSLFDDSPRSADATAISDSLLLSLDKSALQEAIRRYPDVALSVLRVLSRRLRQTNYALQDSSFVDVAGRLARRIAELAEVHGVSCTEGTLIDIPLSQESLAAMVGSTRESVNKALSAMTRRGAITRRGMRYLVSDIDRLRER